MKRGHGLRLAFEAGQRRLILRQTRGQHLHRNLAVQLRVARTVHLTHPARADGCDDFVGTETSAGRE